MLEPVFFEIPIYRTSKQNHSSDMRNMINKHCDKYPFLEGAFLDNFIFKVEKDLCYPWQYNDIIGYLNMYIFGSQLRVDCYIISSKRINKGIIKKKFINNWKIFETNIDNTMSSTEIFEWILIELKDLERRKFRNRHFDLRSFKVIGRFVDWKTLSNELNSWVNTDFRDNYFDESF